MTTEEDSTTLHYLRGRVDSLFEITEAHILEESKKDARLRKVENQLFAMWIVGPALSVMAGIAYTVKQII